LVIAFGLFVGSFLLHIVGGATNQGWLFAIAVALIFVTATGYPAIAAWTSRAETMDARWMTVLVGAPIGVILTASALWAANDRAMAWWTVPVAIILCGISTIVILYVRSLFHTRGGVAPAAPRRAGSRRWG
jgi:hypothetical protein